MNDITWPMQKDCIDETEEKTFIMLTGQYTRDDQNKVDVIYAC